MKFGVFAFLLLPKLLLSEIIETGDFADILLHIHRATPETTLVVCDIDDTLLKGAQHLGSGAWGDYITAQLESKGVPQKLAKEVESVFWRTVQPHIKVEHVDPKAPHVIREIQKQKVTVLGLTARCPHEAAYTLDQLESLDFNLSNEIYRDGVHLNSEVLIAEEWEGKASYEKGVLFSSLFNKKSEVLFAFLEKHDIYPNRIIFVDDRLTHVKDLAEACEKRNITYIGIRFKRADDYNKHFDSRIANIQWEVFPTILSNEEAQQLLNARATD